ncbi:hypothetical protein ACT7DH_23920 [Bacillus pacificus]
MGEEEPVQIICGAANIAKGLKSASCKSWRCTTW